VYRPLQFQKRGQLFISVHNEVLSVAAMRVGNQIASTLTQIPPDRPTKIWKKPR
jgi:hypothetical protein